MIRTPYSFLCRLLDFFLKYKKLCIFLVVVFFAVVGISTLFRGGIGPPPRRTDLTVFLSAAEAIRSGDSIYLITNARGWYYVYTPLLAILLAPFVKLPLVANTFMWYMLSVGSLVGAVVLSARLARDRYRGLRAAVLAGLFCVPSLLESMTRGQLGVITVFLAVAILYLYARKYLVWAAILLAFSVVLKISPLAVLVVFFLVKREWKVCTFIVLGFLLFALVLPSLVIGFEKNWLYLNELQQILSLASSDEGYKSHIWGQLVTPFDQDNQSLYTVLTRWTLPSEEAFINHGNFLVRWVTRGFGAIVLVILAFLSREKTSETSPKRLMLEYSLFPMLMLLVAPVSEIHHYTMLFLMFVPAFLYLDELPPGSFAYQGIMWGAIIAAVTHILGYVDPFHKWGVPTVGVFLFWCALFVFLARENLRAGRRKA